MGPRNRPIRKSRRGPGGFIGIVYEEIAFGEAHTMREATNVSAHFTVGTEHTIAGHRAIAQLAICETDRGLRR